jgi:hypothetical protein
MQPFHQQRQTTLAIVDWNYYRTRWFGVVVFHFPRPYFFFLPMLACESNFENNSTDGGDFQG